MLNDGLIAFCRQQHESRGLSCHHKALRVYSLTYQLPPSSSFLRLSFRCSGLSAKIFYPSIAAQKTKQGIGMAKWMFTRKQTLNVSGEQGQRSACEFTSKQLYAELALPSDSDSIRLLDVQAPPSNSDQAPLQGYLRVARLRDQPAFTTLSYVWGPKISPSPKLSVLPHRIDLGIPESCFQALLHIRRKFGAVTIWVDSICINQDDHDEKISQIPLMQDIYSSAKVGYIWLGEGSEASSLAMTHLKWRARILRRLPLAYLATTSKRQQWCESRKFDMRCLADMLCKREAL